MTSHTSPIAVVAVTQNDTRIWLAGLDPAYYESITRALVGIDEILMIGHGHGKANHMVRFTQYLERKHPEVARSVVGAVDSDLEALTEAQILAAARAWFRTYHRTGIKHRTIG